jgi:hypothetical protein
MHYKHSNTQTKSENNPPSKGKSGSNPLLKCTPSIPLLKTKSGKKPPLKCKLSIQAIKHYNKEWEQSTIKKLKHSKTQIRVYTNHY